MYAFYFIALFTSFYLGIERSVTKKNYIYMILFSFISISINIVVCLINLLVQRFESFVIVLTAISALYMILAILLLFNSQKQAKQMKKHSRKKTVKPRFPKYSDIDLSMGEKEDLLKEPISRAM